MMAKAKNVMIWLSAALALGNSARAESLPAGANVPPGYGVNGGVTPTIPTNIEQPPPASARDYFRCNRDFVYKGKTYPCDSLVRQDGAGLRPFVEDTPQAASELDTYDATRRRARIAAYIGTFGLLTGIVGVVFARAGSGELGNVVGFSGLALAGAGLIYGVSLIRANETHLNRAVQIHNQAHPDDPIELKFSTGFAF